MIIDSNSVDYTGLLVVGILASFVFGPFIILAIGSTKTWKRISLELAKMSEFKQNCLIAAIILLFIHVMTGFGLMIGAKEAKQFNERMTTVIQEDYEICFEGARIEKIPDAVLENSGAYEFVIDDENKTLNIKSVRYSE